MPPYNILFLCTGNSARSIMAEAILNARHQPNFTAYSAGSHPSGTVRPEALRQLELAHIPTHGLRSKSWDEFAIPAAPHLDFVFTVCDNAANEICPLWPGQPVNRPLGRSRPGGSSRKPSPHRARLPRSLHYPGSQNQPVSLPSPENSRPARPPARTRPHRQDHDARRSQVAGRLPRGHLPKGKSK